MASAVAQQPHFAARSGLTRPRNAADYRHEGAANRDAFQDCAHHTARPWRCWESQGRNPLRANQGATAAVDRYVRSAVQVRACERAMRALAVGDGCARRISPPSGEAIERRSSLFRRWTPVHDAFVSAVAADSRRRTGPLGVQCMQHRGMCLCDAQRSRTSIALLLMHAETTVPRRSCCPRSGRTSIGERRNGGAWVTTERIGGEHHTHARRRGQRSRPWWAWTG